ncbi:MAG: RidA family protein [Planctomycetes bacterium]|nr:RidA family protein [Planctomycetota bacterium]
MESRVIDSAEAPNFPTILSQGRVVGNLLFISGQVAMKPGTRDIIAGDFRDQMKQTLTNVRSVCEAAGTNMERVVKVTIFLTDMRHYATMNEVYKQFFKQPMPTRSTVAVAGLAIPSMLVEIEAIAEIPT